MPTMSVADAVSSAEFSISLAQTVVACHHGDRGEALTSLIGAVVIAAGTMPAPEAMLDVAIAGLDAARAKIAAHRAGAAINDRKAVR